MLAFTKKLRHRLITPALTLALASSIVACADQEDSEKEDEERQSTGTESDGKETGSEEESSNSKDTVESTGQGSSTQDDTDTDTTTTSSETTDTTTEAPPKPTLGLSYRSISEDEVLLYWSTPSDYASEKTRYLVSSEENIGDEIFFAESTLINTASQDGDMDYSVSLYIPGQGVNLAETITIPADHDKDLPDFTMVSRPQFVKTAAGFQTMSLNLNPRTAAARSLEPSLNAEAVSYHLYVDGQERTKLYSDKESLPDGLHTLSGFHPGRVYNIQIQSSAMPASDQVASAALTVVMPALPGKSFEIPTTANTNLAVYETSGARLPDFITMNNMEVSIYVDDKKLADDCKVDVIPKITVASEPALPKAPRPLYVGIKDSCYNATSGAANKVVYEASLKIEATGETFVTRSSNTNIFHQPA